MVQIDIQYNGNLRCESTHGPSGRTVISDAPVDNQGKGESFSPTDLVATALGSCMMTIIGIVAERHQWDITGATARVVKGMVADPVRRIGKLDVVIHVPGTFDQKARTLFEKAALTCPVHQSLGERIEIPVQFEWDS
ncbi:MAG: putative redox protein [Planctomycetota bacterium]|jgi:putative redox protein